jgi:nitrogen-specific signal transduction histidine kinase
VTLIVVTQDANLCAALVEALGVQESSVRVVPTVELAAQTCAPGASRWMVIDAEKADGDFLAAVQKAKSAGFVKIAGLVAERSRQWEEKAIVDGVVHFFDRPINGAIWRALGIGREESNPPFASRPEASQAPARDGQERRGHAVAAMLEYTQLMREVVGGELLDTFMERLRRILGATKCLLFLQSENSKVWLTCAYRAGISSEVAANIRISLNEGLGLMVRKKGCIVRRQWAEQGVADDARGEMEVLEADYAIPVHDKEVVRGVLLLGGSVLGEPLGEEALQVIYHLLEELASALGIRKLIEDNRKESELLRAMLDASGEAVIAVDDALAIRYANNRARAVLFGGAGKQPSFHGLPRELASAIYTTLKRKKGRITGRLELSNPPEKYSYTTHLLAGPVVIAKLSEPTDWIDSSAGTDGQRLIRRLGRQLSNELRNGLTSVTTCTQLLAMNRSAPPDLKEMGEIMRKDMLRLGRLADNLYLLSRARLEFSDVSDVAELVKAAWNRALAHAERPCKLEQSGDAAKISINCDRKAIESALGEVFLNAIQAGANDGLKPVTCVVSGRDGVVSIGIWGPGAWVDDQRVGEPFFSTKAVGVGLGLTVARKVVADHSGKLSFDAEKGVEIELPTEED